MPSVFWTSRTPAPLHGSGLAWLASRLGSPTRCDISATVTLLRAVAVAPSVSSISNTKLRFPPVNLSSVVYGESPSRARRVLCSSVLSNAAAGTVSRLPSLTYLAEAKIFLYAPSVSTPSNQSVAALASHVPVTLVPLRASVLSSTRSASTPSGNACGPESGTHEGADASPSYAIFPRLT